MSSIKPLPCPYCGRPPVIDRYRIRKFRPRFLAYHVYAPHHECVASEDYDTLSPRYVTSISEAIKDWNRWAIGARGREGFISWTSF